MLMTLLWLISVPSSRFLQHVNHLVMFRTIAFGKLLITAVIARRNARRHQTCPALPKVMDVMAYMHKSPAEEALLLVLMLKGTGPFAELLNGT